MKSKHPDTTTVDTSHIPKGDRLTIPCSVCEELIYHPKTGGVHSNFKSAMSNKALLGCDDVLCWYCYVQWYDQGITDREEMKHLSRLARYRELKEGLPIETPLK